MVAGVAQSRQTPTRDKRSVTDFGRVTIGNPIAPRDRYGGFNAA
jgi:hypothetical protein